STNNGKTWSAETRITPESKSKTDGHGDAGFILDRKTGNIVGVVASDNGYLASTHEKPIRIKIIKSVDNGKTWSEPVDITPQIYGAQCKDPVRKNWQAAFAASGNGIQLRNGRMLFVLAVREAKENFAKNYVIYSDDGGVTWNVSKNAPQSAKSGDEAKIVELNDGSLIMAIRPKDIYQRRLAKSTDNGETWGEAVFRSDLPSSASNGDIIYYTSTLNGWDKNRIITMFDSIPWGAGGGYPGNPVLYWSYDEGKTWKGRQMHSGNAGYSSLAILKDGSIGILAEIGGSWAGPIKFMRVNMRHLTSNADKGPFNTNQTATNNSKVK
ncbi:sialidase family protein, partial [Brachyspira catarrhinii]